MEFRILRLGSVLGAFSILFLSACNQYAYRQGSSESTLGDDDTGFVWPELEDEAEDTEGTPPSGGETEDTEGTPSLIRDVGMVDRDTELVSSFANYIQHASVTLISPYLKNAIEIESKFYQACAKYNGKAYCWGNNGSSQLGTTSSDTWVTKATASTIISSGYEKIALGSNHTCFITSSGAVRCFGKNYSGELGFASTSTSTVYKNSLGIQGMSSGVTDVSSGDKFACAVRSGTTYCWGKNDKGQLGNYDATHLDWSAVPLTVHGLGASKSVVSAASTSCAIQESNSRIRCWGLNDRYQLGKQLSGVSFSTFSEAPSEISRLAFSQITAGAHHFCGLTTEGDVWCWGANASGQLGRSATTKGLPQKLSNLPSEITKIVAGYSHTCALADGALYCWGNNSSGQLGVNRGVTQVIYPVQVDIFSGQIIDVSAGDHHTCALLYGGTVRCFGYGYSNPYTYIESAD